ncbi:serine hydrolase [Candidatus Omnitrophota bacterium]
MKRKIIILLLFIALCSVSGILLRNSYVHFQRMRVERLRLQRRKADWQLLQDALEDEFSYYRVEPLLIVEDLNTGWQFSHNKDTAVPSASLVKVPIMVCCFDQAARGKINLDDIIALRAKHKVGGSGKLRYAPNGTKTSVGKLIELMIAQSDNTATNVLIDMLGFEQLNAYFKEIGLKNTNISRMMMDFKSRAKGIENYTTVEDMAFLFKKMYEGRLISKGVSSKCIEILKKQKSRDRIPARLPKEAVVAHKTGLEKTVCHDIGIVYTEKGNVLICALTKHKNKNSWPSKKFISNVSFLAYNYLQGG